MLGAGGGQGRADRHARGRQARGAKAGTPALEVREPALRPSCSKDVSFSLVAGEVLGVAALEGQGQEELFDCIAGVRRPTTTARSCADGKELKLRHPADAIRAGLVLVPANRLQALLQQRSIRENVALPSFRGRIGAWGPIAMAAERGRVDAAVARLQIDTRAESELRRLSGGNQQKVVIARWLASGFKTLLCFDPTRGIDIGTKRQIYALVRELAAAARRCCCSPRSCRRFRSPATARSCCSAAASWTRCRPPRPTRRRCCAPRTGWSTRRRYGHDRRERRAGCRRVGPGRAAAPRHAPPSRRSSACRRC